MTTATPVASPLRPQVRPEGDLVVVRCAFCRGIHLTLSVAMPNAEIAFRCRNRINGTKTCGTWNAGPVG